MNKLLAILLVCGLVLSGCCGMTPSDYGPKSISEQKGNCANVDFSAVSISEEADGSLNMSGEEGIFIPGFNRTFPSGESYLIDHPDFYSCRKAEHAGENVNIIYCSANAGGMNFGRSTVTEGGLIESSQVFIGELQFTKQGDKYMISSIKCQEIISR